MKLSDYYKVPGRQVYCETLWDCVKTTAYCHVWLRLCPSNLPLIG